MAQETFTTPGSSSWTCPTGVTSITIECWGAGGNGGNSTSQTNSGAGGGGGGAYSKLNTFATTPGNSYSYQVGDNGGSRDTYFNNTATCLAKGGTAGTNNTTEHRP